AIARGLNRSEKPLLIIGGGVKLGNAAEEMTDLVEKGRVPFVCTMMGVGSVHSANGYNLGFIGTHGNELANRMIHQADFILAVGTRFTDRSTPLTAELAPLATIAQIDIDPTSIGKNIAVDYPYVADVREALRDILPLVAPHEETAWTERIRSERTTIEQNLPDGGCGQAGQLIRQIQEIMAAETTVVADVGLNQIWTVRTWQSRSPRSLITSGGMGTMGFALPAAIGAQIGTPERQVLVISGDGGLYMNIQELATISYYRLPIKIVCLNNGNLGMIRQIQDLFYDGRLSSIELAGPDLVAIARGFGIPARRIAKDQNPTEALAEMASVQGPYLLDCEIDPDNYVFPIVPPGRANRDMIFGMGD
ncbi:MAG: thiamine pyrophosphate-binding protein, partial [Smithellaceae bacterium]|nr:thiamine pyrophosphate-binding protein [Smithellaceae bacterium]